MNSMFRLSKTPYLLGRQCPLRLWLYSRGIPEAAPDDAKPDPVDDFAEQARAVESAAERLFPGGVRVSASADASRRSSELHELTQSLMQDLAIGTLFQAQFKTDRTMCTVDIIARDGPSWILYEVKASSDVKPIFLWDLAFQWLVTEECGHTVTAVRVLHLNTNYVHSGAEPDLARLLTEVDCTEDVAALLEETREEIVRQITMLSSDTEPAERPGRRCNGYRKAAEGNRPSDCGHLADGQICGNRILKNWSLSLPVLRGEDKLAHLSLPGNDRIENLDPDEPTIDWTPVQAKVIRAVRSGHAQVEIEVLRQELAEIEWPVAYIDFEFEPAVAVPPFAGMRPNQKLPFQWSVQIQTAPGTPLRSPPPFLHGSSADPRRDFIESLLEVLPQTGSVVVHSRQAESSVLGLYEEWYDGEFWQNCQQVQSKLFDTCELARKTYYHPAMKCSFSIKKFAPAILGRGYEDLAIQDGMEAVRQWRQLIDDATPTDVRMQVRENLLRYCGRDTGLMHDILEAFRRIVA